MFRTFSRGRETTTYTGAISYEIASGGNDVAGDRTTDGCR
jgi:hypothetical protein